MEYKEIVVKKAQSKQTIYLYLKQNGYSENYLKNLRKVFGYIKLNDKDCFINTTTHNGDIIKINTSPNTKTCICSCIIPLDIVYEDDYILIVNKPSGLSTMPNKSHFLYNLSGGILAYMQAKDPNFVVRIVNRLDKDTAGLVVVAKDSLVANYFNENNDIIQKTYYAVCEGVIQDELVINKNIDTIKNEYGYNCQKRVICKSGGKKATTFTKAIKSFDNMTLLEITLKHGRTHQIRVHLASENHPLVGDELYGNKSNKISHTALCCTKITFIHPIISKKMTFTVPIPNDILALTGDKV